MNYNKLIRDKIPDHLDSKGIQHTSHIATEQEYWEKLQDKLSEEVAEVIAEMKLGDKEKIMEELADVLEVINLIAAQSNISIEDIEQARTLKKEQRGSFDKKIILDDTHE